MTLAGMILGIVGGGGDEVLSEASEVLLGSGESSGERAVLEVGKVFDVKLVVSLYGDSVAVGCAGDVFGEGGHCLRG